MDSYPRTSNTLTPQPTSPSRPHNRLPLLLLLLLGVIALWYLPIFMERLEYRRTLGEVQALRESLPEANLKSLSKSFTLIYQKIKPSVVHIDTRREVRNRGNEFFGNGFFSGRPETLEEQGEASGLIVDPAGYLVTNYHVVEDAQEVNVVLYDGRGVAAEVVGVDPGIDLAVLKINASDLVAATWGDSDKLQVGEMVWAIGCPYGLDQTMTSGIVSAKGRHDIGNNLYQEFLQTDVAINPGNSGGPLVDVTGNVVGINSAIFGATYQGISFAIPSNLAKDVYEKLRKEGRVIRGYLGVQLAPLTPKMATRLQLPPEVVNGALVELVHRGSPAEQAGIQPLDVIVKWNGQPVTNDGELRMMIARTSIGGKAPVMLYRDGEEKTLEVQVSERPETER
ncbi:MAG TPA: trypsin-like peptidase domain-containing protein [Pirellulales bacterium]